ncbi:hypothetical protein CPB86DRAFT_349774 [Serendipita vermifera]|nr:hypothetical protein CPB86DRAFT_349774 [Serendipita vermifera]
MDSSTTWNANPVIQEVSVKKKSRQQQIGKRKAIVESWFSLDSDDEEAGITEVEPIDEEEIFDLIRSINDPEHPHTLESLMVVSQKQIRIKGNLVEVEFTPTVPHCGMATIIGLCIRVRLLRSLPQRFKVDIVIKKGTHQSENAVNKQLNDKERVAAALENPNLLEVIEQCLSTTDP